MSSQKTIIKISIYILAVVLMGSLAVFALKSRIENAARGIYEKRSLLAALEKRESNSLVLSSDYPAVSEALPLIKQALPDKDNISDAVSVLDSLAMETGNVQVLEFKPLVESGDSRVIESVDFTAALTGNIWSFGEYLAKLKKLPYFIEIASVNVSGDAGVTGTAERMNLTAKIYIRK